MKLFPRAFCLLATLSISAMSARATLLEVEPFDYPGSLGSGLNGLSGGTGWGGSAWADIDALPTLATTNTSLSYPSGVALTPVGSRIELTAVSANNPANRNLGTTMSLATNGQAYYSSALFQMSAVAAERASVLFNDGTNIRWFYGVDASGFFSVAVDPSNAAQRSTSLVSIVPDVTYLLVSKMRTNTGAGGVDEVFLKIYQEGSAIVEPATDLDWDLRASGNSGVNLSNVRLSFDNSAGQTNEFDELRIGTTFADVAPVPEPAAASLLALGALLAGIRRRR